jgi:hypothetical protein
MGKDAGFADGKVDLAKCCNPWGVVVDRSDNICFVDRGNHRIRQITKEGNV